MSKLGMHSAGNTDTGNLFERAMFQSMNANSAEMFINSSTIKGAEAFHKMFTSLHPNPDGKEISTGNLEKSMDNETEVINGKKGLACAADADKDNQSVKNMSLEELLKIIAALFKNRDMNSRETSVNDFSSPTSTGGSSSSGGSSRGGGVGKTGSTNGFGTSEGGIASKIKENGEIPSAEELAAAGKNGVVVNGLDLQTNSSGYLTEASEDKVNKIAGKLNRELGVEVAAQAYKKNDGSIGLKLTSGKIDKVKFYKPGAEIYSVHTHPSGNLTPSKTDKKNQIPGAVDAVINPRNPTRENVYA